MLSLLKIKNLALVEDLTWEVGGGLVGVTGETGAGKSIIVGALKLILGERADRSLIRTGENSCTVEASFALSNAGEVNAFLEEHGFDPCEDNELVVKRVFTGTGGNKQFMNCSPATLNMLRELGNMLVDLHGPHDHQSLLSRERQLAMLDSFAGAEDQVAAYRAVFREWREAAEELDALRHAERASAQELDLLRFQVDEIDAGQLEPGEDQGLEQRYRIASNGTRLVALCQEALEHLSGNDGAVLTRLGDVQRELHELEKLDDSVTALAGGFESARLELEELNRSLGDYAAGLEIDPAEISALEHRIDLVETLKRKYGNTVDEVLAFGDQARDRLEKIESRDEELARLETETASARAAVDKAGARLTRIRKKAAPRLAAEISGHLDALGFKQSVFEITLTPEDEPGPRGGESGDFLFAPNPGEPSKPLRIIASSGEMSRVMLAVKSALAEQDPIPLMVFDEIDANVGGEIAHAVGAKMASLGEQHQVVSITHLPQVAAAAACHYVVCKEVEGKRTRSLLRSVDREERVEEIARMLGGKGASERALAKKMLASGKKQSAARSGSR